MASGAQDDASTVSPDGPRILYGEASLALRGRRILITRPLAQARPLAAAIEAAGGIARVFPLLRIETIESSPERDRAIANLRDYDFAAFVSPNAVAASVPSILERGPWPAATRAVAVGAGTARALAAFGVGPVIVPDSRFDSEALLERPDLSAAAVAGRRVAIFRGDGGRELLADELRARGARVDCLSCYRRLPPDDFSPLQRWLDAGELDALSVTSSEALRHLEGGLDAARAARLHALPFFTSHARIAENAARAGFRAVRVTAAGDEALVAGLCAYNWPAPDAS
jgi:uroporphyrinogen-III synthase